MTPAKSLPPISNGGSRRDKKSKVAGGVLKKSIKFSEENQNLVLRGSSLNSREAKLLAMKGGGCGEGNCCIIY